MHTLFQHGCTAIAIRSFEPNNCNALSITVHTETGDFDLVLFGLPVSELSKFSGFGQPTHGQDLPSVVIEDEAAA